MYYGEDGDYYVDVIVAVTDHTLGMKLKSTKGLAKLESVNLWQFCKTHYKCWGLVLGSLGSLPDARVHNEYVSTLVAHVWNNMEVEACSNPKLKA